MTHDLLVHLGYTLMLFALLARDILWLRAILVISQGTLAYYAVYRGVLPIAFWNAVFVCINTLWVIRILRERAAVRLPVELVELHTRHFAALLPQEFLRLWTWGERRTVSDAILLRQGARPDALYFVLQGTVDVLQQGQVVTQLGAGSFVGEMSLLTGEACTADALARGPVELVCWPVQQLAQLRSRNPNLWAKVQSVLGHDLVEKLMRATSGRS